jgi:hypothetical protein
MADAVLHFHCSSCGKRLSVPTHLAGVSGPCPACGVIIQAPQHEMPPPVSEISVTAEPTSPAAPARTPIPKPLPPRDQDDHDALGPKLPASENLFRVLKGMAFIMMMVLLVYGTASFFSRKSPDLSPTPTTNDNANPSLMDDLEPITLWQQADHALESFLAAPNLAERRAWMESHTRDEEIAASCLATPLPAVVRMVPQFRESDESTEQIDSFYIVEFQTNDKQARVQTILVRSRGTGSAKVMADAFLDTYGGRLAHFATNSGGQERVFHAVVYAAGQCEDTSIPGYERKFTLKLMASDQGHELGRAYFNRDSEIAKVLEDGAGKLGFGKPRPCLVTLRWNAEEDPGRPFLEAVGIPSFTWGS